MSVELEQRLATLNQTVDDALNSCGNLQPVHVALPDGGEADVALTIQLSPGWSHLLILGLARSTTAERWIGEGHLHWLAPDPDWAVGHEHGYRCEGFTYADGRFLQPKLPRRENLWGYSHLREHSLSTASYILRNMLTTPSANNVFGPDSSPLTLRRARSLRGADGENQLFVHPILRAALNQRLAEMGS